MMKTLLEQIEALPMDAWRKTAPFSSEMQQAAAILFDESRQKEWAACMDHWLTKHQPCRFGRIAASHSAISYCFITEKDLACGDQFVEAKIHAEHLEWSRQGFSGNKSALIVLLISERVTFAEPSLELACLAERIICMVLRKDSVDRDTIYHDEIFLEGQDRDTWKWKAGVNYFSAQAEGRWWHDHRIPAGLGFSINSVGHFVKSSQLGQKLGVASLDKALHLAMQTLAGATDTVSGKSMELLPRTGTCPMRSPSGFADKDVCNYRGYYHTDYTIPSSYFRPCVNRPADVIPFDDLDFTYLHTKSEDYYLMGEGLRVR